MDLPPRSRGTRRSQRGQASVELVALLPLLALLVVAGWQLVVAGQAVWLSGTAARAAARAQAVGGDPLGAARSSVPPRLRAGVRVRTTASEGVVVRLRVPAVVGEGGVATVTSRARFAPQDGG